MGTREIPIPHTLPSTCEPIIENHPVALLGLILSTSRCWVRNMKRKTVPVQTPSRGV